MSYHYETYYYYYYWLVTSTKFREDNSKIVDFLLIVKVLGSPVIYESVSRHWISKPWTHEKNISVQFTHIFQSLEKTYFFSSSSSPDDLMDFRLLRLPVLLPPKLKAHLFLPALGLELGVLGVCIVLALDEGVK